MRILSHRGLWSNPAEQNSESAFRQSFTLGFGTETDLRDANGVLVISHDVPRGGEITTRDFFRVASETPGLPLALNIKADGLVELLLKELDEELLNRSFVFDMAIPDMRAYLESKIRVFARASEVEREPAWIDRCAGVWLDSFGPVWFSGRDVQGYLDHGLELCVVSPDLHGGAPEEVWEMLRSFRNSGEVMLCTDRPQEAADYLGLT